MAIAAVASLPARFVLRYLAHSPSRRDITKAAEDASWRTPGKLIQNLALLAGLAALAVFIFTPAAASIAQSPSFVPMLFFGVGCWTVATIAKGFLTGSITPFSRGLNADFSRQSQPKRYWASMAWNGVLGLGMISSAIYLYLQGPILALEEQCYENADVPPSPKQQLAACNQLIATNRSDQDLARLRSARGTAYFRLEDFRRAKADYGEAVHLDPKDSSSYYNLGLVNERIGDVTAALGNYTAALRVDPNNEDAYLNRGLIFLDSGMLVEAVGDFTRAHELRSTDEWPLANRGITYATLRNEAAAQKDFATVRAINPSNAVMLRGEALLNYNAGNMQGAVDKLTAALKSDPGNPWALRLRADAFSRLGKEEKAHDDKDELWRLGRAPTDAARP